MYNLYLDDFRDPIDSSYYLNKPMYEDEIWIIVRNYNEFVNHIIANGIPKLLSLDHDIYYDEYGEPEKTGYDCAKWLIEYCFLEKLELPDEIHIHSGNADGAKNIRNLFNDNNKNVEI